jgi:hypothetical protein
VSNWVTSGREFAYSKHIGDPVRRETAYAPNARSDGDGVNVRILRDSITSGIVELEAKATCRPSRIICIGSSRRSEFDRETGFFTGGDAHRVRADDQECDYLQHSDSNLYTLSMPADSGVENTIDIHSEVCLSQGTIAERVAFRTVRR